MKHTNTIEIIIVFSALLLLGLVNVYGTMKNVRELIKYPDSEMHDLSKDVLRIQDDTPIFIARRIVADDISILENDIRSSGFQTKGEHRLMQLLALYEVGQYWEEGNELIARALEEAPEGSVTHRIATNMKDYFASGLMDASPPSLTDDIGMLFKQSMGLLALIAITTLYSTVSLKKRRVTTSQISHLKRGGYFLVSMFLGFIYLRLYY